MGGRGRRHDTSERTRILTLLEEAVQAGARQSKACEIIGIDPRTAQRWRHQGVGEDGRRGPHRAPRNSLSEGEKQQVLEVVNTPEHRDLSPKQIVPRMADQGVYIASESTIYRMLRANEQLKHRSASNPPTRRHRPSPKTACGPNQVWSWDITYLRTPIRGVFLYLYLVLDIWSRKIVASEVFDSESSEHASSLIEAACRAEGISPGQLHLHQDNGSPMKGATFLEMLRRLSVSASFSRPRVSDDNPYSESVFRTAKYRPEFPSEPFGGLPDARAWKDGFESWYNNEHRHSAIRYVTPAQRHRGEDVAILARRRQVYEAARQRHPERWSGSIRNWQPIDIVVLNPEPAMRRPA